MPVLTITRGLPASGKTTYARAWVAENPVGRARVNRDDLRAMCHAGTFIKRSAETLGTEQAVIAARDDLILSLLMKGVDVICDDTNLPHRVVTDLRRLAIRAGAEFDVVDMTDVAPDICVRRDAERERPVGEDVILDHWKRFVQGRPYPLPVDDDAPSPTVVPYVPPHPDATSVILVDVDGTVALTNGRSPYDESRVHEDRPNYPVIATVQALDASGYGVVFMSGRTEGCRDATVKWLNEHVGVTRYHGLFMRAVGDSRKDAIVKAELFDAHIRGVYNVVLVLDDRDQVVKMWRQMGLTVLQVAEGNF